MTKYIQIITFNAHDHFIQIMIQWEKNRKLRSVFLLPNREESIIRLIEKITEINNIPSLLGKKKMFSVRVDGSGRMEEGWGCQHSWDVHFSS